MAENFIENEVENDMENVVENYMENVVENLRRTAGARGPAQSVMKKNLIPGSNRTKALAKLC